MTGVDQASPFMHKTLPQSGCKGQLSAPGAAEQKANLLNRCASRPACRPLQQLGQDTQGTLFILLNSGRESLASLQTLLFTTQAAAAAIPQHTSATVASGSPVQAAGNTRGTRCVHRVPLSG